MSIQSKQQLISNCIAVLQVRRMGGARRYVMAETPDQRLACELLTDGEFVRVQWDVGNRCSRFKLTPAGLHLSNELLATANETL
jgi:hypothetical protein